MLAQYPINGLNIQANIGLVFKVKFIYLQNVC